MKNMLNLIQSVLDSLNYEFYTISFSRHNEITFQGHYHSQLVKDIAEKLQVNMTVEDSGYIKGEGTIDGIKIHIVLT